MIDGFPPEKIAVKANCAEIGRCVYYDLTDLKADICFGAPRHNKWYNFSLSNPAKENVYNAILPDKKQGN